jgi:D-alanine transaminase
MSTPATPVTDAAGESGIRVVTLPDDRWKHCNIKAITLLPNVLLRQQAIDAGGAEAILVRDGFATEGAASNIFIVTKGLLITPPNGPALLPGITRDLILELAGANAIPFQEVYISTAELAAADEIWLTSSTREISPVTRIDDRTIADGRPGPLWRKMIGLYQDYKDAVRRGEAE